MRRLIMVIVASAVLAWALIPQPAANAEEDAASAHRKADPKSSREREIKVIKQEMQRLEQRVEQLETEDAELKKNNAELKTTTQKLQTATAAQAASVQSQLEGDFSPQSFQESINRYLGRYRFTVVGGAAGTYIYDHASNINTFNLAFEPIVLWQLNDWMLFEGTIKAALPAGSTADFELPVAVLQWFLNDYVELSAGIFDQPFGDFYEDQSAFWVNRFITAPLPYGVAPLIPPTDIGVQLRGAIQWGAIGQTADYTVWTANGPGFTNSTCTGNTPPSPLPTCPSTAFVGDTLVGVNNIRLNTHTPAFGARFRVYPLPVDSPWGRLELGASTYDGKWQNGLWLYAWGVDFNYFRGNLQARGEWLETYRQMPGGVGADNRQGWYVQAGYFLTGVRAPFLPDVVNQFIAKLEPLVRYAGTNSRGAVLSNIATTPAIGFSGSPAIFAPHPREVALGLDWWFAPSIVWQNEFDIEVPEAGGFFSDTGHPVGATPNDHAFLSQIAIGF